MPPGIHGASVDSVGSDRRRWPAVDRTIDLHQFKTPAIAGRLWVASPDRHSEAVPDHAFDVDDDQPVFLDDSAPACNWPEVGGAEQQVDAHVD